jgi:hypothetical protein
MLNVVMLRVAITFSTPTLSITFVMLSVGVLNVVMVSVVASNTVLDGGAQALVWLNP